MADRNGYIGRAPSDSAVTVARQTFSPTGVTTDFTFASGYTVGYLDLFLNGTKLIEGVDYSATDTSTISLVSAAINGDILEGVAYKAFNLGDTNRIGIQSAGTLVGNVNTLNFVGAGNSISLNGGTIDVSISGGSGSAGAGGTWSNYDGVTGVTTTKKVKIQNNLEVTGVTTSTGGFVGALTGNVTGNASGSSGSCTGNSATATVATNAQGLTGTPSIIVGSVTGTTGSFSGSVSVGGTLTYEDVTNVDSVGVVTARTGIKVLAGGINAVGVVTANSFAGYDSLQAGYFDIVSGPTPDPIVYNVIYASKDATHRYFGQGSGLGYKINGVFSPWLTLTPGRKYRFLMSSSDMTAHPFRFYLEADKTTAYTTNVTSTATYTEILVTDSTPQVLHYQCSAHAYMGNGVSTLSNVAATQSSGGITTAASSPAANTVVTLNLSTAQHHDLTLTAGITTVTCSGGSFGDSHSVVISQPSSGIATVGFSTFFLFPSGSTPSMSTGSGKVDLVSFVVKRVGAGGTQLLASAGLNYSN